MVATLWVPTLEDQNPRGYPGLHNVVAYATGLYSGSAPEGNAGFKSLAALGVKTIISVDGALPDVAAAQSRGLRYVHLPIGYDGMAEERTLAIARAVRDLPKPIYIHCHHGKHRSAGAAGAAAVTLGLASAARAIERMKVSGTSPEYPGLYTCVEIACVATAAQLDAAPADFPSTSTPTGVVDAMVDADHAVEHLKIVQLARWRSPANHPDLVPAAEAGRLADLLRLLHDDAQVKVEPTEFRSMLAAAVTAAAALEEGILVKRDPAELDGKLNTLSASCKDCHEVYRDR